MPPALYASSVHEAHYDVVAKHTGLKVRHQMGSQRKSATSRPGPQPRGCRLALAGTARGTRVTPPRGLSASHLQAPPRTSFTQKECRPACNLPVRVELDQVASSATFKLIDRAVECERSKHGSGRGGPRPGRVASQLVRVRGAAGSGECNGSLVRWEERVLFSRALERRGLSLVLAQVEQLLLDDPENEEYNGIYESLSEVRLWHTTARCVQLRRLA